MKRINVLYLITGINIGGAERMVYELATRLDKEKYDVRLFCLKGTGITGRRIEERGIKLTCLGMAEKPSVPDLFRLPFVLASLIRLLKKEKTDILHSHLFRANILGRIAGRIARVPVIISSVHTVEMEKHYHLAVERVTKGLVDRFIAISDSVKKFTIAKTGMKEDKIITIFNGIDPADYDSAEGKEGGADYVIGAIGRLHRAKGFEYLLEAVSLVAGKITHLKCFIAGDGIEKERLREKAAELGISDKVIFTGTDEDVKNLIRSFDVFVMSSLWEGLPVVLLEAMASGKPVVATDVGGVGEVVREGETGRLVRPSDSRALAGAILWMYENREKAALMGKKGKEVVKSLFTADRMVKETQELYGRLLKEKGKIDDV